jgi:Flp pilus assembly pilin Flp
MARTDSSVDRVELALLALFIAVVIAIVTSMVF